MTATPRLAITELASNQATPETAVNEAVLILEFFANGCHFKSRAANMAEPGSPAEGDCYLLTGTPTGTHWSGKGGKIALFYNGAWVFKTAKEGFIGWVDDEDVLVGYTGSAWNILVSGAAITVDNDTTLAGNSTTNVPSQHAVKTYVDTAVTGLLDLKGGQDCSANPNYPAASKGDYYFVTVAGKIGGASGTAVIAGDIFFATADNAGGTQASVGGSWDVIHTSSLTGALLAANNLSDLASAATARTNLGATTVGGNVFAVANPSAITFLRVNADNSVSLLSASAFRTAIGAGTGGGDLVASNNLSDVADPATAGANIRPVESLVVACSDETTAISAGTGKVTFRMPYAFTVTAVRASLVTAQTSGSIFTVDINESGTSIISTKLTIDNTEKTSTTAATPPVISDASLADDAEMTVDVDQIGDGTAKGLKIMLIGHRA